MINCNFKGYDATLEIKNDGIQTIETERQGKIRKKEIRFSYVLVSLDGCYHNISYSEGGKNNFYFDKALSEHLKCKNLTS